MNKAEQAALELRAMDDLAAQDSPLHRLAPLSKLIVTVVYILTVVSFHKYDFTGLLPMVLFFGYELFVFIRLVIKTKNEGKKVISAEDEELIKQKAIEEYLRQTAAAQQTPPAEDASAAPKDTTGESDPPANN